MVHFDFHIFGLAQCDRRVFSCPNRVVARVSVPVPVCVLHNSLSLLLLLSVLSHSGSCVATTHKLKKRCSVTHKYNLQSAVLQWACGKGISHKLSVDEICNVNAIYQEALKVVWIVSLYLQFSWSLASSKVCFGHRMMPSPSYFRKGDCQPLQHQHGPSRFGVLRVPRYVFGREPTSCKQGTSVSNGTRLRHDAKKNK